MTDIHVAQRLIGIEDISFDSKQEAEVGGHLNSMIQEGIISSLIYHPVMGRMKGDFLIQFGPMAASLGSGQEHEGHLCFIEYDGMHEFRSRDVSNKINTYSHFQEKGIDLRWLLTSSYEATRKCVLDYVEPIILVKTMICESCKKERNIQVFTKKRDPESLSIEGVELCSACEKNK